MFMSCSFKGCERPAYARGLCRAHSTHLYRYGEPRHLTNQPNEIIKKKNHAEVVLYDRHGLPTGDVVLIDKEDIHLISGKRFYKSHGYAKESKSKTTYLHRIISPCQEPLVCDHINQDKLDCRRSNLRCVTRKENMENMSVPLRVHRWGETKARIGVQ